MELPKSTRLRYISAKTASELAEAVDALSFRVEIKGNPVFDSELKRWYIFFVLPDDNKLKWSSVDL